MSGVVRPSSRVAKRPAKKKLSEKSKASKITQRKKLPAKKKVAPKPPIKKSV